MIRKKTKRNSVILPLTKKSTAGKRILTTLRYIVPPDLAGIFTQTQYCRWLRKKALSVMVRDRRSKKPCALNMTISDYEQKIHAAACANALTDPFTGDTLAWNLVGQYDPARARQEIGYFKQFWLLPSVDHRDPDSDIPEFEICSWLVNLCKGDMTPSGFIALCNKIASHRQVATASSRTGKAFPEAPALYFLPPFLEGILTLDEYRNWLEEKAHHLFVKDQKGNRPCVVGHTCADYKMAIHKAIWANGLLDPFTGDVMDWKSIGGRKPGTAGVQEGNMAPSVDHKDPASTDLEFEICSLMVNECKNDLNVDEFIGLCKKVVAFRGGADLTPPLTRPSPTRRGAKK
jgi:hypothetical protein